MIFFLFLNLINKSYLSDGIKLFVFFYDNWNINIYDEAHTDLLKLYAFIKLERLNAAMLCVFFYIYEKENGNNKIYVHVCD